MYPTFDGGASDVEYSTDGRSNVKNQTSDGRASDVEYSTSDVRLIECRKFDIRRRRFGCQIFDIQRIYN